ncbi:hypothetical protein F5148DRAFT_1268933 [Russula earlei]|uniref:Uncharacterized protein n=1 Tax=Russula earlei TaxID=71964 RepID=A0ACC0TSG5_9AGAM|nr:hypothetical protein F5148DRAFT_1268933 [Russula earlei]
MNIPCDVLPPARLARCPSRSLTPVLFLCTLVLCSGNVVMPTRDTAIVDTHGAVLPLHSHRNKICSRGHHRGACWLLPHLRLIGQ